MSRTSYTPKVGLIHTPELALIGPDGRNWSAIRKRVPKLGKQVLIPVLKAAGYDVELFDLKDGDYEEEIGSVTWNGIPLSKVYVGRRIWDIDPNTCEVWGITNNFSQHRELTCILIRHLASTGRPVVVGGSDCIAKPNVYIEAGASAVVTDKSGAANSDAIEAVLGRRDKSETRGVLFADGYISRQRPKPFPAQDWPLPSVETARLCLGREYWRSPFPEHLLPIGSVFPDIGCDRKCDFCQTPMYKLGYQSMSPQRVKEWLEIQKLAGAKSILLASDQFLGRILWRGGREDILEIMRGMREMGFAHMVPNGLELRKATLGRGFNREGTDLTPDVELINALWGWDGKVGCFHAYIPAERPVNGRAAYAKLLPWRQHKELLHAIARSGIPAITYGVIIGFPDESHETLLELERALKELCQELQEIQPSLSFRVTPMCLFPIPGTPQGRQYRNTGLLRYDDPSLYGGLWTACIDSHHMSHGELSEWQHRLYEIQTKDTEFMKDLWWRDAHAIKPPEHQAAT